MFGFSNKPAARPGHGRMAVRDRYADIKGLMKTESPVIIDGGANQGSTTDMFLKQYASPAVYAFEPIPELAEGLKVRYKGMKNVFVYQAALGAEDRPVTFNVVNNLVSSSVLMPTEINRGYHGANMEVKRTVEVPQLRLDGVLDCEVDLLKLDLQGYELEALTGCEGLLDRIKTITTEVEFVPLYEGQPLFSDIDIFLRARGFRLLNLYELYTHPDGQLTSGDAVYLNRRYFQGK